MNTYQWFTNAIEGAENSLSDAYQNTAGDIIFTFATAVKIKGVIRGVVGISVKLDDMMNLIQWTGISKLRTTKILFPTHILYGVFDKSHSLIFQTPLELVGFCAK